MLQNTVALHRDSSVNIPLPPDRHRTSVVAKRGFLQRTRSQICSASPHLYFVCSSLNFTSDGSGRLKRQLFL